MRHLLALASLLALAALAPSAAAAQCPPVCVYADPEVTLPSDDCPDCVGATVGAGTLDPVGCYDCGGVGAEVGANHEGGETTVHAIACRGGFIYICFVDESVTL